jgi:hypothetical protein
LRLTVQRTARKAPYDPETENDIPLRDDETGTIAIPNPNRQRGTLAHQAAPSPVGEAQA